MSDRAPHSASDSPRSPRSVLRLFSKLPDVREATAVPLSAVDDHPQRPPASPQQPPEQLASVQSEYAEGPSPPPSERNMPSSEPPAECDDHHHNMAVPIVATFPEDRQETRSNSISLFGMFAPAGLPHGDHQTQANAYAVLAAYAENDQEEEEALGDMDLSGVDDSQPMQAQTDAQLPAMHMDAETCKWVGNEQQFDQFDSIVAAVRDEPEPPVRDAVFDVDEELFQQWRQDGERHNRQFANGYQDNGTPDIRDMIAVFTEARALSSQQQKQ
ncbi:hypothetical protein FGB62_33g012 [Gracilaria domingensis]|nr:hypothetical protein FGB62_33g012 [Gracilaria domingensis]